MPPITLLIVDDHLMVREGLKSLFQRSLEFDVIGEAANGREAITRHKELNPDVTLMDLSMPGIGGVEATRAIRGASPDAKVLALTVHAADEYITSALDAGALGYVLKDLDTESLHQAVRTVYRGQIFLAPGIADTVVSMFLQSRYGPGNSDPIETLSERELEVFRLAGRGLRNKELAERLHISVKTVEKHKSNIVRKFNLQSVRDIPKAWRCYDNGR